MQAQSMRCYSASNRVTRAVSHLFLFIHISFLACHLHPHASKSFFLACIPMEGNDDAGGGRERQIDTTSIREEKHSQSVIARCNSFTFVSFNFNPIHAEDKR